MGSLNAIQKHYDSFTNLLSVRMFDLARRLLSKRDQLNQALSSTAILVDRRIRLVMCYTIMYVCPLLMYIGACRDGLSSAFRLTSAITTDNHSRFYSC